MIANANDRALRAISFAIVIAIVAPLARGDEPALAEKELRARVVKSIDLLQRSAEGFTKHRQCFSCHHQAMPMIAIATAKAHGIEIKTELLKKQSQHTLSFLRRSKKQFASGRGTGGQVDTAGYALWTLEEAGHVPDEFTAAVTTYLLKKNRKLDHWKTTSNRPPSEASGFTTTYLAIRGLSYFGNEDQKAAIKERFEKAKKWLLETQPKDTEDHAFRLQTMAYVGASKEDIQKGAKQLLALQRDDGGWGQKEDMKSDAYATGSALVTLHRLEQLKTTDKAYRRGLAFLLKTQLDDGSWHVVSRSKPFQTYFETGFPHKKDQFISAAASSWATTALALALPKSAE